jgi:molybdate transport system ATP-binding protein
MNLTVDIEKTYGAFHLHAAFTIKDGVTGILGASGSGKSVTLKCIAGIERPDRGRIVLDGVTLFDSEKRIDLPPQKRRVGYLFQSYALFPNMTVKRNILCGLHAVKDRAERERIYRDTVRMLGLKRLEAHMPQQLSGGEQQRVALARILVNRPKLLLLDEPFSALDPSLRVRLCVEMREILKDYGGPSILVTHDRGEAYMLCSEIATADTGRIAAPRKTEALFARPKTAAQAALVGIKTVLPAMYEDKTHVNVAALFSSLEMEPFVRPDVLAVAIREDGFGGDVNRTDMQIADILPTPDGQLVLLRPCYGKDLLYWRAPASETLSVGDTLTLGIRPSAILPLYAND